MRRLILLLGFLFYLALALSIGTIPAKAVHLYPMSLRLVQSQPAPITILLPVTEVESGSFISIPLQIEGEVTGQEILAFQLTLDFDPTVLQLNGVSTENTLSANWNVAENRTADGSIMVVGYSATELSASGTLLNFQFAAIGSVAAQTALIIHDFMWNEGSPDVLLNNDRSLSLEELGRQLNMSREQVRQIEIKAMQKLRRTCQAHLREFLH